MVSPREDAPWFVHRVWELVTGRSDPMNDFEEKLVQERGYDPERVEEESEEEDRYGAFQLTTTELEEVVKHYRDWLDDVRAEIRASEAEIESLNEYRKELESSGYEEEARDVAFDMQQELDRLNNLRDERDEVEAKLQNHKRDLNHANRDQRRKERQAQEPVDYADDYDRTAYEDRRREQKKKEQKQQQNVRHHRHQQRKVNNAEQADMSDAMEIIGEDDAKELEKVMNDDFADPDNDWMSSSSSESDQEETWEELN